MLVSVNESVIAYTNRGTAKLAVFMIPAAGNGRVDLLLKIPAQYGISTLFAMPRTRFLHPNPSFHFLTSNGLGVLGIENLCGDPTALEKRPFPAS
jgi:hypothetical protein